MVGGFPVEVVLEGLPLLSRALQTLTAAFSLVFQYQVPSAERESRRARKRKLARKEGRGSKVCLGGVLAGAQWIISEGELHGPWPAALMAATLNL